MKYQDHSPAESAFTHLWEEIRRKQQPPTPEQETLLGELLKKMPTELRLQMIVMVGQSNDRLKRKFDAKFAALELFNQEIFGTESKRPAGTSEPDLLVPDSSYRFTPGFRLGAKLGDGGNAVVYEAELRGAHAGDEPVAVKIFRRTRFTDRTISMIHHVAQEQNLHRLTHPGIVRILTAGDSNFGAFLAMEWVPGQNLKQWIESNGHKPIDPVSAAKIVRILASATQAIHDRGLIHRDIKPGNILGCQEKIDPDQLKLGDFGTSCLADATSSGVSGPQRIEGTIGYMPPEQLGGREDRRTDVFALGMVLLCILTGKSPSDDDWSLFDESGRSLLRDIRASLDRTGTDRIPTTIHNAYTSLMNSQKLINQIPTGKMAEEELRYKMLRAIIERCLCINPDDRYKSAKALEADLVQFLNDQPVVPDRCAYTRSDIVRLFRRRLKRREEVFEPDRQAAWGVAFLAIALLIFLTDMLNHVVINCGWDMDHSVLLCDSIIKIGAVGIILLFRSQLISFGVSRRASLMILIYAAASAVLSNVMFGLKNHVVIAPLLFFLIFGVATSLFGMLSNLWKLSYLGILFLVLSPLVHLIAQGHPDLFDRWGLTAVAFMYSLYCFTLGYSWGGLGVLRMWFIPPSSLKA